MNTSLLKQLEFDLAYLVLLTRRGLKPLSRWEKQLPDEQHDYIREFGLKTAIVERTLRSGQKVEELIFSLSDAYLDIYFQKFDGTPIDKSVRAQMIEGFLFGYPPCCVKQFAHKGYVANDLASADQKILFHWACPGCKITPFLLPHYQDVYQHCQKIFNGKIEIDNHLKATLRKGVAVAASVTFLTSTVGLYFPKNSHANSPLGDPHQITLSPDVDKDQDLLSDKEESYLKTDPNNPDSDYNGTLDGVQLAMECQTAISNLPATVCTDQPYRIDYMMRGIEKCDVCDSTVNMGYFQIINPLENLSLEIPYIGLHYLEHGSFTYHGDLHKGRINPSVLETVLKSKGGLHLLAIENDNDQDGLPDELEPTFNMDPQKSDTNGNGILDGVELARAMSATIAELPREVKEKYVYLIEYPMDGLEACDVCGEILNMGYVQIINPLDNLSIDIPYMGLHYLTCGSFRYAGDTNKGIIDIKLLKSVLDGVDKAHQLPIENDSDQDGLKDGEESHFQTNPQNPDSDGNGILDGVQLAKEMCTMIDSLPRQESSSTIYAIEYLTWGLETCDICGETVNMGYLEIVNPMTNKRMPIYFIGLHYLEHGSFAYGGDLHDGRVDPVQLAEVLEIPVTAINSQENHLPNKYLLLQNYPNPFNASTIIRYDLPQSNRVTLEIYNVLGQKVRTLISDFQPAGNHQIKWDGRNDSGQVLPSGVYLGLFKSAQAVQILKIIFQK